ncbi:hypothetical protein GGI21_004247 [Coemansia aciculifera]|uniref:Uncharacterized protein n=1 Tax=Coemansia aciculifera TaxID=417176 RepID=A0ACC1M262_9FUNG|nr:hypothetical protein IWW38_003285 [Coemansia aciculifera]KAJ2904769.1 hypothetical protein GGI21_004247 [Coemansia aciculifera]
MTHLTQTAFRKAEKKYKRGQLAHDLDNAVDLANKPAVNQAVRAIRLAHDLEDPATVPFRLFTHKRPPAYVLRDHPGLLLIPNPFTDEAQRWLARKCLCDCPRPPNRTNLDAFFDTPPESLFALASDATTCSQPISNRAEKDILMADVTLPKDRVYTQPGLPAALLERQRWCTLGMQYNWTTKEYDRGTSPFDQDIDCLMRAIAIAITRPEGSAGDSVDTGNEYDGNSFASEAGIVNYYDERATMAGHVDKTEEKMDAPLISLSIGLSCVFLIGGMTRDTEPTPIVLRSGDVLAMCGESRMAYHGVPVVLDGTTPEFLNNPSAGTGDVVAATYPEWHHFAGYLTHHRINCNARKCS